MAEIATASAEQSEGVQQVNTAVSQINRVTQSNASHAEETAAAGEELNAQSQALNSAVSSLEKLVGARRAAATQPASKGAFGPANAAPMPKARKEPRHPITFTTRHRHVAGAHGRPNGQSSPDLNFADV